METDVKTHSPLKWRLGNPVEEGNEGLKEPEVSRTLQENLQNRLTWAHRGSKRLNCQPENMKGMNLGALYICNSCVAESSCRTLNAKAEAVSDYTACLLVPFP